ncbi:DUF397 domain-containing protein [Actinomadura logoneensis]|uniref:DUF397 domain-containing protein n=1 Tax=Actinomadura logoneensis TaxID=2293572 RepID=A0A372JS74_9ACTN|nr:DUF397 domain-containing protein [Actinomadura logoneensis]RFU42871.1 DUF397 domain-containing protein [Actinomadura logoneensis]
MTVEWSKATRSNTTGGDCVEVARLSPDAVAIRDSKDTAGPRLTLTASAARRLVEAIRAGGRDAL